MLMKRSALVWSPVLSYWDIILYRSRDIKLYGAATATTSGPGTAAIVVTATSGLLLVSPSRLQGQCQFRDSRHSCLSSQCSGLEHRATLPEKGFRIHTHIRRHRRMGVRCTCRQESRMHAYIYILYIYIHIYIYTYIHIYIFFLKLILILILTLILYACKATFTAYNATLWKMTT